MKRQTNLTLDHSVVKRARDMGLNLSREVNEVLHEIVGGKRTPSGIQIMFLLRENHELKERVRELQEKLRAARKDNRERPRPGTRQPAGLQETSPLDLTGLPRPGPRQV